MVNSVFTSNGVFTKNNPDTTMFYWDLDGFGILSNSRGFTHLAERFQLFMLHWITMELNLGSSVAGANHAIVVCYQPSLEDREHHWIHVISCKLRRIRRKN